MEEWSEYGPLKQWIDIALDIRMNIVFNIALDIRWLILFSYWLTLEGWIRGITDLDGRMERICAHEAMS